MPTRQLQSKHVCRRLLSRLLLAGGWPKKNKVWEVQRVEEWKRVMWLGRGAYGNVSMTVALQGGFYFTVKSAPRDTAAEIDLQNERMVLQHDMAEAPNIIRCLGWTDSDMDDYGVPLYSVFLEYMHGDSLQQLVNSRGGRLFEEETHVYTRAIVRALLYIHSRGIVHCDVKCANVLLKSTREVKERAVKLADLGFPSRFSGRRLQEGIHQQAPTARDVKARGTWSHMAPELWASGFYTPASQLPPADIWSLGCTVVSMLQGKPPWGNAVHEPLVVTSLLPTNLPADCQDFINQCLHPSPASRWTSQ
ncbi:hypothetical protein L7F22_018341 [Adiantum nelumboides]|nr:hypothetical protein [Adiantum nelumboides]